ncbi:MAG TPA: Spy/CpxP family protein refolding chaperone [Ramlibacter sp.]|nr:Spy/CpxP family protein refolding chaperone [Ramlibacter sp.]
MKYAHKLLVIAGLLAAFGMAAGAQTPSAQAQNPGQMAARDADSSARMQQHKARMQEHMAKRLADFKQKLQLSPGQEAAWNSYVDALKPSGMHQRRDRADLARLPTPERIDRMRALRAERMAQMDRRGDATKTFYAILTPQQQKIFDDATARRGEHHHGRQGVHRHTG